VAAVVAAVVAAAMLIREYFEHTCGVSGGWLCLICSHQMTSAFVAPLRGEDTFVTPNAKIGRWQQF
jgi:hypothetical protein